MHKPLAFLDRLQPLFNALAGIQAQQPLPRAYCEPASWQLSQHNLQLPAAWRRRPRVR